MSFLKHSAFVCYSAIVCNLISTHLRVFEYFIIVVFRVDLKTILIFTKFQLAIFHPIDALAFILRCHIRRTLIALSFEMRRTLLPSSEQISILSSRIHLLYRQYLEKTSIRLYLLCNTQFSHKFANFYNFRNAYNFYSYFINTIFISTI